MLLLKSYLESNVQHMMDNNVRLQFIGRVQELPGGVQGQLRLAREVTAHNTGTTLTLALNYSGRSELVDAFRELASEIESRHLDPERVFEEDIRRHLYTAHMPDPIRHGGRGFLLRGRHSVLKVLFKEKKKED